MITKNLKFWQKTLNNKHFGVLTRSDYHEGLILTPRYPFNERVNN